MTPETMAQIAVWRQKAIEGTMSLEDMKAAVKVIRGDRVSASYASEKSRAKKADTAVPDADDLLKELGGL